jgi:hypothetical protein
MKWHEIDPSDATDLNLADRTDIDAPLNEMGERCPWPWEPQQLVGVPLGQYHCPYCGAMCVAGVPHPDYSPTHADKIRLVWDESLGCWIGGGGARPEDRSGPTTGGNR